MTTTTSTTTTTTSTSTSTSTTTTTSTSTSTTTTIATIFLRIFGLSNAASQQTPILNLREISAFDSNGIRVPPLMAKMSSEKAGHEVDKCYELSSGVADKGWCESASNIDNNPWILFQYPAEANIQNVFVKNRNYEPEHNESVSLRQEFNARIANAQLVLSRDEAGTDVLWTEIFDDTEQEYSWNVTLDLGME